MVISGFNYTFLVIPSDGGKVFLVWSLDLGVIHAVGVFTLSNSLRRAEGGDYFLKLLHVVFSWHWHFGSSQVWKHTVFVFCCFSGNRGGFRSGNAAHRRSFKGLEFEYDWFEVWKELKYARRSEFYHQTFLQVQQQHNHAQSGPDTCLCGFCTPAVSWLAAMNQELWCNPSTPSLCLCLSPGRMTQSRFNQK